MSCGLSARARATPMRWRWPPGELVREPVRVLGREADDAQQLVHAQHAPERRGSGRGCTNGSLTMSRTVMRGLSDAYGSWKTICISLRTSRISRRFKPVMSRPLKTILPEVGLRQLDQRAREGRLAAPGLADEAEGLAGAYGEVDAVDGVDVPDGALEDPGADREVLDEVLHAEDLARRVSARSWTAASASATQATAVLRELGLAPDQLLREVTRARVPGTAVHRLERRILLACTRSRARKQRGWNGQPGGRSIRDGGCSGDRMQPLLVLGQLRQAVHQPDRVRMPRRAKDRLRRSPDSTMCPAYMTRTRSHISATMPGRA